MKNDVCPGCGRHCTSDAPHCRRGMEYFGIEIKEEDWPRQHSSYCHSGNRETEKTNVPTHEKILIALRECGHYLHHNFGPGNAPDSEALMSSLSEEEQTALLRLLEKCKQSWRN